MKRRCPICKEYTEMKMDSEKWSGRTVYECEKCNNLYLKCHKCDDGVAKVRKGYDDFFCEECGKKIFGGTTGTLAIVGLIVWGAITLFSKKK